MTEPTALDMCVRARSRYEYEYSSAIRITDDALAELARLRDCERELAELKKSKEDEIARCRREEEYRRHD